MQDYSDMFRGKKITVLGLGLLGRGVGDVEFLAQCGAELTVTDKKSAEVLAPSLERLKQYSNITYHLGGHLLEDFKYCDMVLKSAGVRLDSPEIAAAKEANIPVVMSTALFAQFASFAGAFLIGVTGTRGKSTVTHMIYHTLQKVGRPVALGGNVRGLSTLSMLSQMGWGQIVVLELDSWQLQGFGDLAVSPHIAIITNLMQDHQNYYPDMDTYFADKANIFKNQKEGYVLIAGKDVLERVKNAQPPVPPRVPRPIPDDWNLKIPGEHNRINAAFAYEALKECGVGDLQIKAGLESFEAVEGRLQLVDDSSDILIYNDNNATTPEATIAGLRAVDEAKNVVLIAGGADKGLDVAPLIAEMKQRCKAVILLAGTGTDRIRSEFSQAPLCVDLASALAEAKAKAENGDVILFSPGFASFGMFQNEYDRNDQFIKLIRA